MSEAFRRTTLEKNQFFSIAQTAQRGYVSFKMSKEITTLFGIFVLIQITTSISIPFDEYEKKNVQHINELLDFPFTFDQEDHWHSRMDRYLFYSMALSTMKNPLELELERGGLKQGRSNVTHSLNLSIYAKMSQTVSNTLRSSAKEAEFYITRHGKMKTASGKHPKIHGDESKGTEYALHSVVISKFSPI